MSKVRAKCANCHKTFRASPKQTLCDDCARKARAASKLASTRPTVAAAPIAPPKITGPGASILDPRLAAAAQAETHAPDRAPTGEHDGMHRHGPSHPQAPTHAPAGDQGTRTSHGGHDKGARHDRDKQSEPGAVAARAPRPRREPKPPTPPFEVTPELRARIETRYLELAQPEFNGIRTQLAQELGIPKPAVKRIVQELRANKQLPSWWDLQAYTGTPEDLERIRAVYTPLLPLPAVGVHKHLATELGLEERLVYQGIRRIRAEMHLPQYNPPEAHSTAAERGIPSPASVPGPAGGTP